MFWLDRAAGLLVIRVLVLLPVQRVDQPPRGRLGAHQRRPSRNLRRPAPRLIRTPPPPPSPPRLIPRAGAAASTPAATSSPSTTSSTFTVSASTPRARCGPEARRHHATVFVGGRAQLWWWSGESGAAGATRCRALSGRRLRRGPLRRRRRHPDARSHDPRFGFNVVLLPEPERLDAIHEPGALLAEAAVLRGSTAGPPQSAVHGSLRGRKGARAARPTPGLERHRHPSALDGRAGWRRRNARRYQP